MSVKKVVKKSTRAAKKVVKQTDFSSLLRDGLSSYKSYVVLKQKNRSPIYLAFKPFVNRLGQTAIYIGGKLSAFPNKGHEAWSGIDYEGKLEILKKAFKTLPQDRVGEERIGSNAGIFVSAANGNQKQFEDKIEMKKLVKALLDGIEKELDIEIENRADVAKFLTLAFPKHASNSFYLGGQVLPTRQVGKVSEVQFGQAKSGGYGNQALSDFVNEHHLTLNTQVQAA